MILHVDPSVYISRWDCSSMFMFSRNVAVVSAVFFCADFFIYVEEAGWYFEQLPRC